MIQRIKQWWKLFREGYSSAKQYDQQGHTERKPTFKDIIIEKGNRGTSGLKIHTAGCIPKNPSGMVVLFKDLTGGLLEVVGEAQLKFVDGVIKADLFFFNDADICNGWPRLGGCGLKNRDLEILELRIDCVTICPTKRNDDETIESLYFQVAIPAYGINCPNCGNIYHMEDIQEKTEAEFRHEPDPHYFWEEVLKCNKCETLYKLNNGT